MLDRAAARLGSIMACTAVLACSEPAGRAPMPLPAPARAAGSSPEPAPLPTGPSEKVSPADPGAVLAAAVACIPAAPAPAAAASAPPVSAATAPSAPPAPAAPRREDAAVFASPRWPWPGAVLRLAVVSEQPTPGAALYVRSPDGTARALRAEHRGGPPWSWYAEVPAPEAGVHRVVLARGGAPVACQDVFVNEAAPSTGPRAWGPVWPAERAWDRAFENLYSAWIEKMFDDPLEAQPSWPALHDVLRDPKRNLLHGHLGAAEDEGGPGAIVIDPDCADLPYFLRAYFAFKLGLPFGYSECTRGGDGVPPSCHAFRSNLHVRARRADPVQAFGELLRVSVADTVHSGTGRASATDDAADYYPVQLTRESLRPGAIYADPYGHVLVVARRVAQTEASGGILLAIDGQPDGTIARKRFWRGNFLFASDAALGSPGFKRFRPVVVENGVPRALSNAEIARHPSWGDFGLDQYEHGVEGFYDRMDDVLSPTPIEPLRAMRETVQALEEQVKTRVQSVDNGDRYMAGGAPRIDMPKGAGIFETTGAWEDFSTPSRDLRLLIAIDVVRAFPERVARRPERYALRSGQAPAAVRADLEAALRKELAARRFTYRRSDGSPVSLSLTDVLARAADLEMAYNPNDCVELRWGAPPDSDEASTCRRRAPPGQLARMRRYRAWFHDRKRPPRGFAH